MSFSLLNHTCLSVRHHILLWYSSALSSLDIGSNENALFIALLCLQNVKDPCKIRKHWCGRIRCEKSWIIWTLKNVYNCIAYSHLSLSIAPNIYHCIINLCHSFSVLGATFLGIWPAMQQNWTFPSCLLIQRVHFQRHCDISWWWHYLIWWRRWKWDHSIQLCISYWILSIVVTKLIILCWNLYKSVTEFTEFLQQHLSMVTNLRGGHNTGGQDWWENEEKLIWGVLPENECNW